MVLARVLERDHVLRLVDGHILRQVAIDQLVIPSVQVDPLTTSVGSFGIRSLFALPEFRGAKFVHYVEVGALLGRGPLADVVADEDQEEESCTDYYV